MKFYRITFETYLNGEKINTFEESFNFHANDSIPKNTSLLITWKNIIEIYHRYGSVLPFNLDITKRGKRINRFDSLKTIKEWCSPCIDLVLYIKYTEIHPTMREIIDTLPHEQTVEYLKENNIYIKGE